MSPTEPKITYREAVEELEEIVQKIEDDAIAVDDLAANVKRAAELIAFCKGVLKQTETEVNQIITGLEDEEPA